MEYGWLEEKLKGVRVMVEFWRRQKHDEMFFVVEWFLLHVILYLRTRWSWWAARKNCPKSFYAFCLGGHDIHPECCRQFSPTKLQFQLTVSGICFSRLKLQLQDRKRLVESYVELIWIIFSLHARLLLDHLSLHLQIYIYIQNISPSSNNHHRKIIQSGIQSIWGQRY